MIEKKHDDFKTKVQQGFTLIEIVVSIGIVAILIVAAATFVNNMMITNKRVTTEAEIEDTRMFVRNNFDCRTTLNPRPAACDDATETAFMDLFNKSGQVILSRTTTDAKNWFGKFHLRARCIRYPQSAPVQRVVWIEYRIETAPNADIPARNPVTKNPYEWTQLHTIPTCTLSL